MILRRSSVLSQGWYDPQQGKIFVHIPGMTVSPPSGTPCGLSDQVDCLLRVTSLPFGRVAIFLPQQLGSLWARASSLLPGISDPQQIGYSPVNLAFSLEMDPTLVLIRRTIVMSIQDIDKQRRNTKKYRFRQPDLKKLRSLTSYVLDPLEFKAHHGKLLSILATQLLPTLEEYAYLVGIPILDQLSFSGLERVPSSQEIADMLHIDESIVGAHMTTKGGIHGLPSDFLIAQATYFGKAMSEDIFEAIFVLLIYGLVLFPNIDNFVDVNAIRIFSALNPVPTQLGDTYLSLHMRNAKGGGTIVCCLPLLYKWFISHLPQTLTFKKNKGCLRWSTRLMSLTNDDIFWYKRVYDGVQIIDSCGEFSNVPLLGTCGGINYNPVLARR
ncbi:hypothetical protein KIW84_063262 [Lathyrus oleraceus]|uniref:DUF7745 domain-containing protein n=1 Tax=Pisum sativum TaxID=3888 RepID=A0A9D4W8B2_PEA|nr:hypothetical protein KIW84_063262 [Pisum sativum]